MTTSSPRDRSIVRTIYSGGLAHRLFVCDMLPRSPPSAAARCPESPMDQEPVRPARSLPASRRAASTASRQQGGNAWRFLRDGVKVLFGLYSDVSVLSRRRN